MCCFRDCRVTNTPLKSWARLVIQLPPNGQCLDPSPSNPKRTALVEIAAGSGLDLLAPDKRKPNASDVVLVLGN